MTDPASPQDILTFWFEDTPRRAWFNATPAFDAALSDRFKGTWSHVAGGGLLGATGAQESLARLIVLDQFTRNLFRGTPKAFSGDTQALALARAAVAQGHDAVFPDPDWRQFFYHPFTHAEDLAAQEEGVALLTAHLGDHAAVRFGRAHRDAIARFGRFPHRNNILGRDTTPEEQAYLDAGGGFR